MPISANCRFNAELQQTHSDLAPKSVTDNALIRNAITANAVSNEQNSPTFKEVAHSWNKALRSNFSLFLRKVFHTLHGNSVFKPALHIPIICAKLREVEMGPANRVIINIPPRALKSVCVSVAWPAWLLGHNPAARIIVVSYSQALSNKHSYDCRHIMASSWYQQLFPHTIIARNYDTKAKFVTTKNGFRFATSTGGTLTGEGADYIIIDDPQNPSQVMSENEREKTYNWFQQTLTSRLNDREKGKIIIVMQRLHQDDLCGLLTRNSGHSWDLLRFPLINAEESDNFTINGLHFIRPPHSTIASICPDSESVSNLRKEVGEYTFAAQYQQSPLSAQNGIIKAAWLHYADFSTAAGAQSEELGDFTAIYQSWDCAIKNGLNCDYTTCLTIGEKDGKFYIIDVLREKLLYNQLKECVISQKKCFNAQIILVEDKAAGQQLLQEMRGNLPLVGVLPKNDKVTRLVLVAHFFESGAIVLPKEAPWLADFKNELLSFPRAKHDDQVDALTQFLTWRQKNIQEQAAGDYWKMRRL